MIKRSHPAVESPEGPKTEPEFELTDERWQLIKDLFLETPVGPKGGRPVMASRSCVEGILWILRSGARWKDMPSRFPSATTCWRRHRAWTRAGIWEKAWARLIRQLDREGRVDREESFADGTFSSAKKGAKRSARQNAARAPRSWSSPMAMVFRSASTRPALVPTKSLSLNR